jgi:hypothetical protein
LIRKIEIEFAIPVELTDDEQRRLCDFVQRIAKRHQPDGMVHWQSGCGSKPIFSQADSRFLGKPVDPSAPERGEPEFDDEVYHIETYAREAYESEIKRDKEKQCSHIRNEL